MSTEPNPVSAKLSALMDATLVVGMGPDGARRVAGKALPEGIVQTVTLYEAAEQAGLTMANNALLEANTAALLLVKGELAAGNGIAAQTLAAQQQAAMVAAGAPCGADWTSLQPAGGQATLLTAAQNTVDRKVLRAIVACSTLAGTIVGGSARIWVYHCAGPNDAWNAAGAVVVGEYRVASGASYAVANGRAVPAGRHLRVQATNGGCGITLDVA